MSDSTVIRGAILLGQPRAEVRLSYPLVGTQRQRNIIRSGRDDMSKMRITLVLQWVAIVLAAVAVHNVRAA
jgi:hypothetical protein